MTDPEIVKVTVIIETEKTITTVNVPKSTEPRWNAVYSEPEPDWTGTKMISPPELLGLELAFAPFKDEAGITHTIVVTNKEEIDGR